MELNRIGDIAAFVAVVKAGSFTNAAKATGLTRSAVGKSVVRLEAQLGVRLLNRTTRSLSLTDEGHAMYERCRQILEDLEEVDEMMARRRLTPSGTLKLTAPLSFGQRHILPVLNAFLSLWPELQANISFTDRFVDLIEEGFDIAIRIGKPAADSRVLTRTIAWQHMVTCASPAYLARRGTPLEPRQLPEHDAIFFMNAERRRTWRFAGPDGPFTFEGPGRVNIDSSEAMRASAISGFGLVQLPRYMLDDAIRDGRLVTVLDAFTAAPEPIRAVYPSKRHLSPRIRAFIDFLVERLQQNAADDGPAQLHPPHSLSR
jgi:DNA-binding transcriptional LysR family regulator